ncbi:MAG: cell wall hydrolase [Oscillospiraceae bacterium]|jgi:hypothetical protein|nr:cell wall hydrolase [Oscillospiraceae bacterium]
MAEYRARVRRQDRVPGAAVSLRRQGRRALWQLARWLSRPDPGRHLGRFWRKLREADLQGFGRLGAATLLLLLLVKGESSEAFSVSVQIAAVPAARMISDYLEKEPEPLPCSREDLEALARTVYGESFITKSDMEMAAVAWCILNRVDHEYFPNTIYEVVTAEDQFHGYNEKHPLNRHILWLVEDVVRRWDKEKKGRLSAAEAGRVLDREYLYFWGDGLHNHFTTKYHAGKTWDWSLPNPYES